MIYLGGMMSSSGDSGTELNRPLGMARKDFDVLCRIWKHTRINLDRKVKIFDACVVAKLMYCMHTVWLNKAELLKLDAFQARCLRKLAGIPHPYISRISNQVVLNTCGSTPLSSTLTYRQLLLMGKIATMPDDSAIRRSVFMPGTTALARPFGARRRGRPRNSWKRCVYDLACQASGGPQALSVLWQEGMDAWRSVAKSFCSAL